jgi:hypothetical protein
MRSQIELPLSKSHKFNTETVPQSDDQFLREHARIATIFLDREEQLLTQTSGSSVEAFRVQIAGNPHTMFSA